MIKKFAIIIFITRIAIQTSTIQASAAAHFVPNDEADIRIKTTREQMIECAIEFIEKGYFEQLIAIMAYFDLCTSDTSTTKRKLIDIANYWQSKMHGSTNAENYKNIADFFKLLDLKEIQQEVLRGEPLFKALTKCSMPVKENFEKCYMIPFGDEAYKSKQKKQLLEALSKVDKEKMQHIETLIYFIKQT